MTTRATSARHRAEVTKTNSLTVIAKAVGDNAGGVRRRGDERFGERQAADLDRHGKLPRGLADEMLRLIQALRLLQRGRRLCARWNSCSSTGSLLMKVTAVFTDSDPSAIR